MVKTYTEWRLAYNDCKFCYDFLNDNEERLRFIINPSSAGHLCLLEVPLTTLLLMSVLIWNGLSDVKISPELFLIVFLSINLFIVTAYFIYYPTQHRKIIIYRTKIGIYQETWPTIIDVITNAEGDSLPKEPERLNFVELSSVECLPIEEEEVIDEENVETTTLIFRPLIEKKHEEEPKKKQPEEKIYTIEELCAQYGIEA